MSFKCSVCWELLSTVVEHTGGGPGRTDVVATRCGHLYHTVCLQRWLQTQNNTGCPTCRADVRLRDCLKLYPSRDREEEEISKVTKLKKKVEKLERELHMEKVLMTITEMDVDSLKIKLDKATTDLGVSLSAESSLSYQIVNLKKENKSLEELVKQSKEQCAGLENRLGESEAKCVQKQEELELAKRFTDVNAHGIIQGLSLGRDLFRQELRALYVQPGGIVNAATRIVKGTEGLRAFETTFNRISEGGELPD